MGTFVTHTAHLAGLNGPWLAPPSFEDLGQTHNKAKLMVTGLEVQRYRLLNVNEAQGHMRDASLFWSMLDGLPKGSLLALSDLRSEHELQTPFPGCTVSEESFYARVTA